MPFDSMTPIGEIVRNKIDSSKPIGTRFDSKFKTREQYNILSNTIKNLVEIECKHNGKVVRIVKIFTEREKTIVEEHELVWDEKERKEKFKLSYANVYPVYHMARSDWIGRVCSAAYEHANNGYDTEYVKTLMTK